MLKLKLHFKLEGKSKRNNEIQIFVTHLANIVKSLVERLWP